jgi:hypothetical protein
MSEERKESEPERTERLQKAFDEAAGGLDLRLEPAGSEKPRSIGIAFMAAPQISFDTDDAPPPVNPRDDREIERLIHGHESLTPEQYHQGGWRDFLFDPHMALAKEGLIHTDQAAIDEFLASPRFLEFQQQYPWKEPREVKIKNVQVTYIGPYLAAATYRVIETSANGKVLAGNAATLCVRLEGAGWRGAVITKGGREERHPRDSEPDDQSS